MARDSKQSDRKDSPGAPDHAEEAERLKRLLNDTQAAEVFDPAARQRLGKLISAAVAKPRKRKK
jgi:hypothetical protein